MHIAKNWIFPEYFAVKQRFHKNFANCRPTFECKYAMNNPAFIDMRQTGNPDSDNNHQKTGDKQQPNSKWPYKRGNFHSYELTGLYLAMLFLISMITFRRLIPRGQTNMHLPQSIHFCISDSSSNVSPRRNKRFIRLTLKLTRSPALQVAVHTPHDKQTLKDGSISRTSFNNRPSN
jgi:hypothetical protein